MHKPQKQVEDFHRALGLTVGKTPAICDAELRAALILEEAIETAVAIVGSRRGLELVKEQMTKVERKLDNGRELPGIEHTAPDLVEAIDGMCDTLYVVYGTAVAFGVDLEKFYDEVHRTNMAKVGGPIAPNGKRLKPPGWQPPKLREILDAELKAATEPPPHSFAMCNRHDDCDAADEEARRNGRGRATHCYSDDCEDCFGQ